MPLKDDDVDSPAGLMVGKKFLVGKFIAGGSFGRLYTGTNIKTKEEVAIKMELKDIDKAQLPLEFFFYKQLKADGKKPHWCVPKIHFFGPCGEKWIALIMDMLGPSIEKVHDECGSKFSLKTTCMLAIQLMEAFEYFHGCQLIFRDTKPENFLFGRSGTDDYATVHIIDLGLSKQYIEDDGKHIKFIEGKGVTGTVRYMSVNNHKGFEASRRDDMIAVGYMLVYLAKGELPWMGVKADGIKEKYRQIAKIKEKTKLEALCEQLPQEFAKYLKEVLSLEFAAEPNYRTYKSLFERCLQQNGLRNDGVYDFDRNHKKRKR